MAAKRKKTGRRSKCTTAIIKRISAAIEAGNYANVAAEAAGISEHTYYNWLKKGGKAKNGIFFQFFQTIKKAEATAEQDALKNLLAAAREENAWTGYAWYLERKFPARWAKRE